MGAIRYHPDAASYEVSEIVDLFEPHRLWDTIGRARNQLLYGGAGSGKTMILKRLWWPSIIAAEQLTFNDMFTVYFDARELETLSGFGVGHPDRPKTVEAVSQCLATLTLLQCMTDTLSRVQGEFLAQEFCDALVKTADTIFSNAFGTYRAADLPSVSDFCLDQTGALLGSLHSLTRVESQASFYRSICGPEHLLRIFSSRFRSAVRIRGSISAKPRLGILVDQYEMLPLFCRPIFNRLLKRESEQHFFTIVASRPFAFDSDGLRPPDDFECVTVEYLPDHQREYLIHLRAIWARLAPTRPDLDTLLDGGPHYFAEVSSRSLRTFFNLCAAAVHRSPEIPVRRELQRKLAVEFASGEEHLWKSPDDVPTDAIWRLLRHVVRPGADGVLNRSPKNVQLVGRGAMAVSLSPAARKLLRKGFELSALQFGDYDASRVTDVPHQFQISSTAGVLFDCEFDGLSTVALDVSDVEQLASVAINRRAARPSTEPPKRVEKAFLAYSFDNSPELNVLYDSLRRIFGERQIVLEKGEGLMAALRHQTVEWFKEAGIVLVDLSNLKPNVVFELGVGMGLMSRVVPIFYKNTQRPPDLSKYPFLRDLGHIPYDLTQDGLRHLRDNTLERIKRPLHPTQTLQVSTNGSGRLRVRQRSKTIAIYYPSARRDLWDGIRPDLLRACELVGFTCLIVQELPFDTAASIHENLVWCICSSDRVLIDTTGENEPDLYGAFGLGYATAMSRRPKEKRIFRTAERNYGHVSKLSLWESELSFEWSSRAELLVILDRLLRSGSKHA